MPIPSKGPRLYLRPDENVYVIRDGAKQTRTGCSPKDRGEAERLLSIYIRDKHSPIEKNGELDKITIDEVLEAYERERVPFVIAPARIKSALKPLRKFWTRKRLSDMRGRACREYADQRADVGDGTIRRELGTLNAAINHWHKEYGPLVAVPKVTLPASPAPKEEYLERSDVAKLLGAALGFYERSYCDLATREERTSIGRSTQLIDRTVARFIVLGLYTGTRHAAILGLRWEPNVRGGHYDPNGPTIYRKSKSATQTKKRQPPVRVGRKLRGFLARWKRIDEALGKPTLAPIVSNKKGSPIDRLRGQWHRPRKMAGLPAFVTPHILRHTRATWLMREGVDTWEAAGSLGMDPKTLESVYGHHSPEWQKNAAEI